MLFYTDGFPKYNILTAEADAAHCCNWIRKQVRVALEAISISFKGTASISAAENMGFAKTDFDFEIFYKCRSIAMLKVSAQITAVRLHLFLVWVNSIEQKL